MCFFQSGLEFACGLRYDLGSMKPAPPSKGLTRSPRAINDLRRDLLAWYRIHRRDLPWRRTQDPYRIWVSEVMLQQTQVATVIPYYERFLQRFPDLRALARADLQDVLKVWEGLGYYRRVHHLHRAACELTAAGGGRVPDRHKAFRRLPGVGDYIANAVMSIAFGQPRAVVDGNVKRVLARLEGITTEINHAGSHRVYQAAADDLLDRKDPGTFNQALMELGALACTPRQPACPRCPWQAACFACQNRATADLPRRIAKAPIPEHAMAAGLLVHRGRLLVVRRPSTGLLSGLWEFPAGRRRKGESARRACRRILQETTGLQVRVAAENVRIRHAYTHFKIVLDLLRCRKRNGRVRLDGYQAFRWLRPEDLENLPFTGASKKAFPRLPALLAPAKRRPRS
jgi:A/G-specific adenine glycosylase